MKSGKQKIPSLIVSIFLACLATRCALPLPQAKHVPLDTAYTAAERTPKYHQAEWIIARASLHNHTTYSDGCRSPEDLLDLARIQGMAILAYTDHREGKVCLGKSAIVCAQAGGVEKVGYGKYYAHLAEIQKKASTMDMIVTKGVEVSPPYMYNYGKFPNFVLGGQFNHFTVYSIEDPQVLENMPAKFYISLKPSPIPDEKPYQEFINYIIEHDGIVHAVHVEEGQDEWFGPLHFLTPPPAYNMHLKNLTGFAVLPSAWHEKTGQPGGLWDTVLLEYMAGMRDKPIWASADADYHGPKGSLAIATTLFYMKEFTEDEVYRCMRQGRMVALQGLAFQDSYVAEWWVSDTPEPSQKIMLGKEIVLDDAPVIRFALDHPVEQTRTRLIRNGVVIAEVQGTEITFKDENLGKKREPAFYRVEVIGPTIGDWEKYEGPTAPEGELFTNPIFVRFSK